MSFYRVQDYIFHGYRCATFTNGNALFGVLAVDPFHPWHGCDDSQIEVSTFQVGLRESVDFKIGGSNDWLIVVCVRDAEDLLRVARRAYGFEQPLRPPQIMIDDFEECYLEEMRIKGCSAHADRIDTWDAYVSVCVANKFISERKARQMWPPRELFMWEI